MPSISVGSLIIGSGTILIYGPGQRWRDSLLLSNYKDLRYIFLTAISPIRRLPMELRKSSHVIREGGPRNEETETERIIFEFQDSVIVKPPPYLVM